MQAIGAQPLRQKPIARRQPDQSSQSKRRLGGSWRAEDGSGEKKEGWESPPFDAASFFVNKQLETMQAGRVCMLRGLVCVDDREVASEAADDGWVTVSVAGC